MSIICMIQAFILHHFVIVSSTFHLIRSRFSVFYILRTILHQDCMCMAYLVVFRYFGCFWSSNRGKTEHEVRMPNDAFSKSALSQPRSPARANHSIATPEKQTAQFHSIAKPEESPIRTTRSPLDHQEAYLLVLHSIRQVENEEEKTSQSNHWITTS